MRRLLALTLLLAATSARSAHAQHFDLEASADSLRLGDVLTLRARIHIGPQQTLASHLPVEAEGLPDGARIVGVDTLAHQSDRTLLVGAVRMAFFRPGRLRVPPFRVIVKATPDDRGFLLESEPLYVDVVETLPPGNPTLKDIRDQEPATQLDPLAVAAALGALVAAIWFLRRMLARRPRAAPEPVVVVPVELTAAARARAALQEVEAAGWIERGEVARYYEAVAAVMRDYLQTVEPTVHEAQTSSELLRVLATHRSNGTWRGTATALRDADLVKFAGVMPDARTARGYSTQVMAVIDAWARPEEH